MKARGWKGLIAGACIFPAVALAVSPALAQDIRYDTLQALQVTTPIPYGSRVPGDFDGDGTSDLLLFNPITSQLTIRSLTTFGGRSVLLGTPHTFAITPGYFVAATGDFNGDGRLDIVFTSNQYDLYIWYGNGQGGFNSRYLDTYPVGWMPIGAGDVDGDGQDDLLWRNADTCQFATWIMRNGARVASQTMAAPCGDYPVSIGYYSLRPTVSVIWTNAQADLVAWDSGPKGWAAYSMGKYNALEPELQVLGGGYQGTGISYFTGSTPTTPGGLSVYAGAFERSFDASFRQTAALGPWVYEGGAGLHWISAGFIIQGAPVNAAGVIFQADAKLALCLPGGTSTLSGGTTPMPSSCQAMTLDPGWSVVGAMANGIVPATNP